MTWTTRDRVILAMFGGSLLYLALLKSWKGAAFGAMMGGLIAHWKQNNGK